MHGTECAGTSDRELVHDVQASLMVRHIAVEKMRVGGLIAHWGAVCFQCPVLQPVLVQFQIKNFGLQKNTLMSSMLIISVLFAGIVVQSPVF